MSTEEQTKTVTETTAAAPTAAPTAPAQPGTGMTMTKAVTFLKNVQVQRAPLLRKVNFLMSKGMAAEDILTAFQQAGGPVPVTLKEIQDIVDRKNTSANSGGPTTTNSSSNNNNNNNITANTNSSNNNSSVPTPPTYSAPPSLPPPPQQPVYQQIPVQHQPYPQSYNQGATAAPYYPQNHQQQQQQQYYNHANTPYQNQPPQQYYSHDQNHSQQHHEEPHHETWGWKDYFIASTVGLAGVFASYKAFEHFSPYTVVRKDDVVPQQGGYFNNSRQQSILPPPPPPSSTSNFPVFQPLQRPASANNPTHASISASPSADFSPNAAAAATSEDSKKSKSDSSDAKSSDLEEQVKKLTTELEDANRLLKESRSASAQMAISAGQTKGVITRLNAQIEKANKDKEMLNDEIKILKVQVDDFEKKAEPPKKEGRGEGQDQEKETKNQNDDHDEVVKEKEEKTATPTKKAEEQSQPTVEKSASTIPSATAEVSPKKNADVKQEEKAIEL